MSGPRPEARGATLCLAILAAALAATTLSSGQQPAPQLVRAEDAVIALFSLQTQLDVDNKVLMRMEQRLIDNQRARNDARERTDKLYVDLDALFARYRAAVHGRPGSDGEAGSDEVADRLRTQIESKRLEVMAAERVEAGVSDEGHKLRDDILALKERMTLLSTQLDTLVAGMPTPRETVTGVWDITLMPSGDKGVFALFQSGTMVNGQYTLAGPFQGSLDGTLIDRKLLLHRIDSRLGRTMDLSASLSADGQALRGTWENYDLSNGQARTGSWAARRRPPRRTPEEPEGAEEGAPR